METMSSHRRWRSAAVGLALAGIVTAASCGKGSSTPEPAFTLPPPDLAVVASAATTINAAQSPILALHEAAANLVAAYSPSACESAVALAQSATADDAIAATEAIGDPLLNELVADEVGALMDLRDCPAAASIDDLRDVDSYVAQRLAQLGVSQ